MTLIQLHTAADAAIYLRLTETTICRLARAGKLRGVQISNRWRFSDSDLALFLSDMALNSPLAA